MSIVQIQHTLQGHSGQPEDRFVNSFWVVTPSAPDGLAMTSMADAITAFYSSTGAGLGSWLSRMANAPGRTIKMYDWAEPKPRVPIYERSDVVAPFTSSTESLPAEVACCLSFEGTQQSGVNQARRRGRIYLGPLSVSANGVTSVTPFVSRPSNTFRAAVLVAAENLRQALLPSGIWSVFSPRTFPEAGATAEIVRFWVDDAWDTQRRRGVRALATDSFPVPA